MKKYIFSVIFILFLAAALGIYFFFFRCTKLQCISIDHLSLTSTQSLYEFSRTTYRALYTAPYGLFRIEKQSGLSKKDADNLTTVTVMTAQGLFENARSPYPGPISDEITCDTKFSPKPIIAKTNRSTMTWFMGYLNSRLQYGACIDDQITYKGYVGIFYCPSHNSWYKAEILIPMKEGILDSVYISLLTQIQCK